jgi:hypothetical protein
MSDTPSRPDQADREHLAALLPAPAERDLPEGLHPTLKEYLMVEIQTSQADVRQAPVARRWRGRRLVWAAAVAVAVAAAVTAGSGLLGRDDGQPDVLAFGTAAVSPRLQQVIDFCRERAQLVEPGSKPRLVNRGEAGQYAIAVFLTDTRMISCDGSPTGGGGSYGPYKQPHWLPGPISVEGVGSTEWGGGDVFLAGRVSGRVGRVELHHGDGRVTIARLNEGTFAVATDGAHIGAGKAVLVTYDKAGTVIDRRAALFLDNTFVTADGRFVETCWTDPAGTPVYGAAAGSDCKPAESW